MNEPTEATSPPSQVEREVMLKVIDHGNRVELLYKTADGWVTIHDSSRAEVLAAVKAEASEARQIEARARQRAEAFEWAGAYLRGASPRTVGAREIIGEHAVDTATRKCIACGAIREYALAFRRCDGDEE